MRLPSHAVIGEHNLLLTTAGIADGSKITMHKYLRAYGFDIDSFSANVRTFFAESLDHYDRLAYRNAIAGCWGLNMNIGKDRDLLWERVRYEVNYHRGQGNEWVTGLADPPVDEVKACFLKLYHMGEPISYPLLADLATPVRMAIARTLIYIRVRPPEKKDPTLPDADEIPPELKQCWKDLRRHPYYRNPPKTPLHDLNQHALDSVAQDPNFKKVLWLEPHQIGALRSRLDWYDLRLISSVKHISDLPLHGTRMIFIALVDQLLHFRVFNSDGKIIVDMNETGLPPSKASVLANLRSLLEHSWSSHKLTESETIQAIIAVTSLVGRTRLDNPSTDQHLLFWFWPYVIFKHATRCRIDSSNHHTQNPWNWIWNIKQAGYSEIWRDANAMG